MTWQIRPFCEIDPSISVPAVLTFLQDWFILKHFLTLPSLNFWVSSKEVLESSGFSDSVRISVIRYMILQQHLVSSAWILWGPVVKHTAMKDQMSCSCLTWQSPVCFVFVYVILAGLLAVFYSLSLSEESLYSTLMAETSSGPWQEFLSPLPRICPHLILIFTVLIVSPLNRIS